MGDPILQMIELRCTGSQPSFCPHSQEPWSCHPASHLSGGPAQAGFSQGSHGVLQTPQHPHCILCPHSWWIPGEPALYLPGRHAPRFWIRPRGSSWRRLLAASCPSRPEHTPGLRSTSHLLADNLTAGHQETVSCLQQVALGPPLAHWGQSLGREGGVCIPALSHTPNSDLEKHVSQSLPQESGQAESRILARRAPFPRPHGYLGGGLLEPTPH